MLRSVRYTSVHRVHLVALLLHLISSFPHALQVKPKCSSIQEVYYYFFLKVDTFLVLKILVNLNFLVYIYFFTKRKKGYRTPIKIIRWTTPLLGKVIVIVRNSYFGYYRQCYTNNKYLDGTDTTLFLHPSFFYFCFNNFLFLFKVFVFVWSSVSVGRWSL